MAIMLEQLGLEPARKCWRSARTGYNAGLMAYLAGEAGRVVTVDIAGDIVETARGTLPSAGLERVR
jgi:protein-L-isoaspartate(D-aspartate) O-methyltransferase